MGLRNKDHILAACIASLPIAASAAETITENVIISDIFNWQNGFTIIVEDTVKDSFVECIFMDENKKTLGKVIRLGDHFASEIDVNTSGRYYAGDVHFYICVQEKPKVKGIDQHLKDVEKLLDKLDADDAT